MQSGNLPPAIAQILVPAHQPVEQQDRTLQRLSAANDRHLRRYRLWRIQRIAQCGDFVIRQSIAQIQFEQQTLDHMYVSALSSGIFTANALK